MASKPCVLCDRILHMLIHLIALMCGWVGESQHGRERLDNCLFKSHPQSFRHSARFREEAAFVKPWLEGYLMEHQRHWCRMMLIVKVLFCFGHCAIIAVFNWLNWHSGGFFRRVTLVEDRRILGGMIIPINCQWFDFASRLEVQTKFTLRFLNLYCFFFF